MFHNEVFTLEKNDMKIILIGYMGSGKTTIGKKLAEITSMEFKDLDTEIEKDVGLSVDQIFAKKGEIYFRKKEREVLESLLNANNPIILSTGGGTPCFGDTIGFLISQKNTQTIYLKASINTLTERLFEERNTRPLISHLGNKEELYDFISKHLFERSYYYHKASVVLDVNNLSVNEIAEKIKKEISI